MKKVVIFGYYGNDNLGDEANLFYLVKFIKEHYPKVKIDVITADPERTVRRLGPDITAIPKFSFKAIWAAFKSGNFLIGGGGSLFQDITSRRSVLYYTLLVFLAKLNKMKIILYGQGIGPLKTQVGQFLARLALTKVDLLMLRDRLSVITLAELNIRKPDIHFTADPLLQIDAVSGEQVSAFWHDHSGDKPRRLGVVIRETSSIRLDMWYSLLDSLKWDRHLGIFLIVLDPRDMNLGTQIATHYGLELFRAEDWEYLQMIIGGMDFILSARLHGLVAAVTQGVNCGGIAVDPKIDGFCLQLEIPFLRVDPKMDRITLSNQIRNILEKEQTWESQKDFWKARSFENQFLLNQYLSENYD